jgi:hypothetical protein
MTDGQVQKLMRAICRGDVYRYALAGALCAVIERCPDVPDDVLAKITLTVGRDGYDAQTNAALVVAAWQKTREGADAQHVA